MIKSQCLARLTTIWALVPLNYFVAQQYNSIFSLAIYSNMANKKIIYFSLSGKNVYFLLL